MFEGRQYGICDGLFVRAIKEVSKVDDGDLGRVDGLCHAEVKLRDDLLELKDAARGTCAHDL